MKKIIIVSMFFVFNFTNIVAQCFMDRHNTTWFDEWISCAASMNPNPVRAESHWILYNLNHPYELYQMHIWNTNAPEYLTYGMQNIAIDISNDGNNWIEVGEFEIPIADGTSTYEGLDLFDFEGSSAQYILITGLTNHGGSCFGLSEIRIDVADAPVVSIDEEAVDAACLSAKIFPNPVNGTSKAIISSYCNTAPIIYSIHDISGKVLKRGEILPASNEVELEINSLPIVSGYYILSLRQLDMVRRVKIVKVE